MEFIKLTLNVRLLNFRDFSLLLNISPKSKKPKLYSTHKKEKKIFITDDQQLRQPDKLPNTLLPASDSKLKLIFTQNSMQSLSDTEMESKKYSSESKKLAGAANNNFSRIEDSTGQATIIQTFLSNCKLYFLRI